MINELIATRYPEPTTEMDVSEVKVGQYANGIGFFENVHNMILQMGWENHPGVEVILRLKAPDIRDGLEEL